MNQKDRLFLHPDWGRKNNRYAKTHETNTFGYAYSSQKQPDCHDALTSYSFSHNKLKYTIQFCKYKESS